MKKFTSKNIFEKFILAIVCVILLNFCIAPSSQAAGGTSFGGKMMSIMRDFTTAIADVAASVVQLGMTGEWNYAVDTPGTGKPDRSAPEGDYWIKDSEFRYPILQISPEVIFANKVQLLDANFISSQTADTSRYLLEAKNTAPISTLRSIVASWYVTLRTIAVVGLLSVLIYVGIRIIISSTAQDKAKYKQRLIDWVIAFCLLFFMHYIMAAVVTVVDKVNDMLSDDVIKGISLNPEYGNVEYDKTGTSVEGVGGSSGNAPSGSVEDIGNYGDEYEARTDEEIAECDNSIIDSILAKHSEEPTSQSSSWSNKGTDLEYANVTYYSYDIEYTGTSYTINKRDRQLLGVHHIQYSITTRITDTSVDVDKPEEIIGGLDGLRQNSKGLKFIDGDKVLYFTNYARMYLNVKDKDEYLPMSTAYLIIYIALITFTVVFTIRYIKRVIYIAFLTLMAPMVALTYPIDKIRDRKSTSMGYVV